MAHSAAPTLPPTRAIGRPRGQALHFRLAVLGSVGAAMCFFRLLRWLVWSSGVAPQGPMEKVLSYGALLCALPVIPASFALAGLLLQRRLPTPSHASPADSREGRCVNEVSFRIVTRGEQPAAVRASVDAVRRSLGELPLFPYRIEVVTDMEMDLAAMPDLGQMVIPADYRTPAGSRYKARALHYALEASNLAEDGWIFHLDEETHLTRSAVVGIRDAILEEERSRAYRIGQGMILYHRNLDSHPFFTLADMIRTGEDLGRFHAQHRLGFTLFGLHGSFILVRNNVERAVGFDVGPEGSLTEDAFWALRQMARGQRCRWVEGCVIEQAPASLRDFLRQRRRWFSGLVRVVLYAETKTWIRLPLALSTTLWAVSWLGMAYALVNLGLGLRWPPPLAWLGDGALAMYTVSYLIGLYVNLRDRPRMARRRRILLFAAQLVLVPVFTLLEAAAVVYALVAPERQFHVVRK
ncbi:MAG: hypothetical protein NVSMB32_13220 [Actinomycetota bacterium]